MKYKKIGGDARTYCMTAGNQGVQVKCLRDATQTSPLGPGPLTPSILISKLLVFKSAMFLLSQKLPANACCMSPIHILYYLWSSFCHFHIILLSVFFWCFLSIVAQISMNWYKNASDFEVKIWMSILSNYFRCDLADQQIFHIVTSWQHHQEGEDEVWEGFEIGQQQQRQKKEKKKKNKESCSSSNMQEIYGFDGWM